MYVSFEFSDQIFDQCFSLRSCIVYSVKSCGNILLFKSIIALSIFFQFSRRLVILFGTYEDNHSKTLPFQWAQFVSGTD